jgi:2,4-dichlorophenol 6-monooxygenase
MPAGMKRAFKRVLTYPAYRLVGRALRPGRVRDRVQKAIDAQINHFDRLGLDIGYVYENGAVVSDGTTPPKPDNEVATYVPTTCPGARLPHAWVQTENGRKSTHDFLSYERFSLLARNPQQRFGPLAELGVNLVDTIHFPEDLFPEVQVLLVRPDGHVAWRSSTVDSRADNIISALDRLLSVPSETGSAIDTGRVSFQR